MEKSRFVYFMKPVGRDGPVKIGCSFTPISRLDTFMMWSPEPLEIAATAPGNMSDEYAVHRRFAHLHSHCEWFRADDALTEAIKVVALTGSLSHIMAMPDGPNLRKGAGKKRTEGRRLYISYAARVRIAKHKLQDAGVRAWREPDDVGSMMSSWSESFRSDAEGVAPDAAQFDRLHEYLADPRAHSVVPYWQLEDAA